MFLLLHSALPISEICNSVTKFASLDCVPGLSMFDTSSGLFRHFTTILHHQTMAVTWTWGLTVGDIWKYHHQTCKRCVTMHSGPWGCLSSESISAHFQGLQTPIQLPATSWSDHIWISGWILPHFDVRTISVAWKLKELSNIFWQKIFFLWHHA